MNDEILLIEDNEQNRYLVTFLLEASGFTVVSASTGVHGIHLATKMVPRLVLLDIQLPLMDGYEVARELRKIAALAAVPIVAVTSYAMPGDKEKALEAGCNGYIEKPIDPGTFISQIKEYMAVSEKQEKA